jgi:hypothetical protein
VSGAYKATAARTIETELYIPPLDLHLNGRIAQFEKRLGESGMGQFIRDSYSSVAQLLRRRRRRLRNTNAEAALQYQNGAGEWVQRWLAVDQGETDQKKILATIHREWRER